MARYKPSFCIRYILTQLKYTHYHGGFILKDIMSNKSISYKIKK